MSKIFPTMVDPAKPIVVELNQVLDLLRALDDFIDSIENGEKKKHSVEKYSNLLETWNEFKIKNIKVWRD